ncbi:hypothetical protein [Mycobacterium sp. 852013-51886_SCH5428379]|uniref:hypothetical protein n=1 Tax=Mycobacterium sp. 852013-51886_SCH5428379 TaxID=1834111 RepID=UPI0035165971
MAAHERRHDPPAGIDQHRCHLAPAVGGVGEAVQAQRDRGVWVLRSPDQRPQLHGGGVDVEPPWFGHTG